MTDARDIRPVLLRGGRVIDPSQDLDRTSSVLLTGGTIAGLPPVRLPTPLTRLEMPEWDRD